MGQPWTPITPISGSIFHADSQTVAKLRLAITAMGQPETKVGELCKELEITRQTLYRHVSPDGMLRSDGENLLKTKHK